GAILVRPARVALSMGRRRARPSRRIQPDHHRLAPMADPSPGAPGGSLRLRRHDGTRCWEDRRVESRYRVALILGCSCLAIAAAGCSDAFNAGPLQYVEADALTKDLGPKANLHGKPNLQNKVRQALVRLYGKDPQNIRVPEGSGLTNGGIYLAN